MSPITAIETDQLTGLFVRLEQVIGPSHWIDRVTAVNTELKGSPHFADLIREENRIAFALYDLSVMRERSGSAFKIPPLRSEAQYDAYVLIPQFLQLYDSTSGSAQHALLRRMQSSFRNPDDLRAIEAEWLVAVHLQRQGFRLEFPEMTGLGTFDLLGRRGELELEVECKSISGEKGNPISRREAGAVQAILRTELEPIATRLRAGLLVRVISGGRYPKSPAGIKALCGQVTQAVLSGQSTAFENLEVRLQDFAITDSPFASDEVDQAGIQAFAERLGVVNRDLMVFFRPGERAFVLSLESERSSRLVESVIETAKDACDRQLTGTRAGAVCIKLEALTADELREIGAEEGAPSALRMATSQLMDRRRSSHLICIAYLSDGPLARAPDGGFSRGGSSYLFENSESPFYDRDAVAALGGLASS